MKCPSYRNNPYKYNRKIMCYGTIDKNFKLNYSKRDDYKKNRGYYIKKPSIFNAIKSITS